MNRTQAAEWTPDGHPSDALLMRAIDGELSAGEASRVATHLEACWACRAKSDQIVDAIGAVVQFVEGPLTRNMPVVDAPEFERRLRGEAQRLSANPTARLRSWRLPLAIAAGLALVLLAHSGAIAWIVERLRASARPPDHAATVPVSKPVLPPPPAVAPAPAVPPITPRDRADAIEPAALALLEVETLATVDAAGVLLGGQIDVARRRDRVEVTGLVEDEATRRQLAAALKKLATSRALRLKIRTVEEGLRQTPPSSGPIEIRPMEFDTGAIPAASDLRAHLARSGQSGDLTSQVRTIAASALRRSRTALLHALAIESLVERYDNPAALHALNPRAYDAWQRLIVTHASAFVSETRQLRESLEGVFVSAADQRVLAQETDGTAQTDTRRLGQLAVGIDDAIRAALTASNEPVDRVELRELAFWRTVRRAERLAEAASKP
jgi:hypothetical protein